MSLRSRESTQSSYDIGRNLCLVCSKKNEVEVKTELVYRHKRNLRLGPKHIKLFRIYFKILHPYNYIFFGFRCVLWNPFRPVEMKLCLWLDVEQKRFHTITYL